jgi:hypothetical protein
VSGFAIHPGPLALAAGALVLAFACKPKSAPTPASSTSAAPSSSSNALPTHRTPKEAPLAGERQEIPGGAFFAGSVPGDVGRVPELEPRRYKVELGPFQIDKLPYPNDPARPPLAAVTRDEARRHCSEAGSRLCTELEWERACKGPNSDQFAGGAGWDPECEKLPNQCASGFDVLAMGGALREWTDSDVAPAGDKSPKAAVRGAPSGTPTERHRCAARDAEEPTTKNSQLGFRCCSGAPNAARVVEPKLEATFKKAKLSSDELSKLLAKYPETQELATDIRFFKEPDSAETVVSRGPGDRKGFSFTVQPLLWNPAPGAEFLLVSARSGENRSFVVAFHVLGDGEYRLASSFILRNEPGPVAFAYDGFLRPRLHFSTCWGCPGETGKILFRKPERPVILQP